LFLLKTFKTPNGLLCADVPLRNYSLTHPIILLTQYAEWVQGKCPVIAQTILSQSDRRETVKGLSTLRQFGYSLVQI